MNTKAIILSLFLIGFQLVSLGQTANIDEGCYPLSVQFTAPGGSTSFFWDFGDGATSTQQNPSNIYITDGIFVVSFSESAGGTVLGTVTINVYAPPTPSFNSDVTGGCAPVNVSFSDNTTLASGINITAYTWIFSDGAAETGSSTSHVFSDPGTYNVSYGITTNLPSCDATNLYTDYITVSTPPSTSFTTNPNPPQSCTAPLTVTFNNTSTANNPLTYSWTMGNGETSTATNPPSQTYDTDGSYPVVLTATDNTGCASTSLVTVGVGQSVANFIVADTVCINTLVSLENLSVGGSYFWEFGPNAIPPTSTGVNPIVSFNTPGLHDITLNIGGDCPNDTTITVFVEEVSAIFMADPTYSCESPVDVVFTPETTGASYLWTFENGDILTDPNPTYTYMVEDTTTYSINGPHDQVNYFTTTLLITTNAGCTDFFSLTDTIHEPNALAFPDIVDGCAPLTVEFTDASLSNESIVEWEYIYGDGNSDMATSSGSETNTYTTPGAYDFFLIITNDAGCKDTSFVQTISVGSLLNPSFTVDNNEVCPGETIQFTNTTTSPDLDLIDAWHYGTEGDQMFHCFQESNPEWVYTNLTGSQDVTLTVEYNGCFTTVTQTGLINVLGPIAEMSFQCDCDNPFTVEFINNSHDATSVIWDFGDGNTSTDSDPTHTYDATGDYNVTLQAINNSSGCEDSFETMIVHIRDIQAALSVNEFLCQGLPSGLSGGASVDVEAACYKGYTFYFSDPNIRPITSENPGVNGVFPNTGPTEVFLEVTDINGCTDVASQDVTVYGIQAQFEFTPELGTEQICFPSSVLFEDLSTSDTTIVDWSWNFGDEMVGVGDTITHEYLGVTDDPDLILVSLLITNSVGCVSSIQHEISVYYPTSDVGFSDSTICSGTEVDFTATDFTLMGSNLIYNWDFGNSETSTDQNPSQTFVGGGSFDVQLDFEEVSTGCQGSTNTTILVADYPIAGFFTEADSIPILCPNENIIFTDSSIFNGGFGSSYTWDFGNGSTSTFQNPGTSYSSNGEFTVELIVEVPSPFGCADTTSQNYTVDGPIGSFFSDLNGASICRLDEVLFTLDPASEVDTFYWDFGDGILSPGITPVSHQYTFVPPSGETFAVLVMSNDDGSCPATDVETIHIHEVISEFDRNFNDLDTAICFQPYPLTNTSVGGTNFSWDFGDNTGSSSEDPGVHLFPDPGTYEITLAISNSEWGCTDTIAKSVVLFPLPELIALGDSICEGDIGYLTVPDPHPIWEYTWTTDSEFIIDDATMPDANSQPLNTSTYTILVTDTNACTNESTVPIIVFNEIVVSDFETIVPLGDTVIFPLVINTALYEYTWTPEDTEFTCLDCNPPWVQAIDNTEYIVEINDKEACFTTSASFIVDVYPETFVTLPTTFTPNGDGINDVIFVEGWGIKELLEYKIFNRWGEVIFESTTMDIGWDGHYKGVLQNNDVYVYKVIAKTWKDEIRTVEGHINLMR